MQPITSTILVGDVLDRLSGLPERSVHCVVTSPPYWGLRDYGTALWVGGSDPTCEHRNDRQAARNLNHSASEQRQGRTPSEGKLRDGIGSISVVCAKCGARRVDYQIGLEPTPDQYVARMVEVFREVRRVLRGDGTLWLNMGDCYATGAGSARSPGGDCFGKANEAVDAGSFPMSQPNRMPIAGLKAKDLVGMPWRLAFALQADGWWLRSDIIWHKPNPMPESVTDRPTKAHEYLFLLTKSERYFYDAEAIKEEAVATGGACFGSVDDRDAAEASGQQVRRYERPDYRLIGRNRRSVWMIPTQAFPEAHFATFPEALVEPCIRAGTSEHGCCAAPGCSAPWVRVMERTGRMIRQQNGAAGTTQAHIEANGKHGATSSMNTGVSPEYHTIDWKPSCRCPLPGACCPIPCTVLDPFLGSGTSIAVANRLGRSGIGIELNPKYAEMAERRIAAARDEAGLFLSRAGA